MGERATCPQCGAHLKVIHYEGRHPDCGWNCDVRYDIDVDSFVDGSIRRVTVHGLHHKPSRALLEQVWQAAMLMGIKSPELRSSVTVDGFAPERMTDWLDPFKPTPKPTPKPKLFP